MATDGKPTRSALLLTCSMPKDRDLAALLFRSVDRWVSADIRHLVVVPGKARGEFRQFETSRREIVAQEDVLPYRVHRLPAGLSRLAPIVPGLRRPLYLSRSLKLVRGWILQQSIKFEVTRRAAEDAVVHVDSDVFFVRPFAAADVFGANGPRFFRTGGTTRNPLHRPWLETSARLLDLDLPPDFPNHYVENCVVWSSDIVRRIFARVEERKGTSLHQLLMRTRTFSEYYIYGAYVDLEPGPKAVEPVGTSLCNSFWPSSADQAFDLERLRAGASEEHKAMAIQSTIDLSPAQRAGIYEAAVEALNP
jgi:hypothetical protein